MISLNLPEYSSGKLIHINKFPNISLQSLKHIKNVPSPASPTFYGSYGSGDSLPSSLNLIASY